MLDTDYERALAAANDAETSYLDAVRRGEERELLIELAMDARARWLSVARVCAVGEDVARSRITSLPLPDRHEALEAAWLNRRNWAACGEEASAKAELAGALMNAHRGESTVPRRGLRLVANDG